MSIQQTSATRVGGALRRAASREDIAARISRPTEAERAANRREIANLTKFTDPGDYHLFLARALKDDGENSMPQIANFFGQLASKDRSMAGKLLARFEQEARKGPAIVKPTAAQPGRAANGPPAVRTADFLAEVGNIVDRGGRLPDPIDARVRQLEPALDAGPTVEPRSGAPKPETPESPKPGQPTAENLGKPDKPKPANKDSGPRGPKNTRKPAPQNPCKQMRETLTTLFDELLDIRREIPRTEFEITKKEAELERLKHLRYGDQFPDGKRRFAPEKKKPNLPKVPIGRPSIKDFKNPFKHPLIGPVMERAIDRAAFIYEKRVRIRESKAEIDALGERLKDLRHKEENWGANVEVLTQRLKDCEASSG